MIQAQAEPPGCEPRLPQHVPRAEPDFPRLSSLSRLLACHLTVPVDLCELHSLLSIRWAEESGRVLRSARYPCSIQARTAPPGCQTRLPQSPRSDPVARDFFCSSWWASLSGNFRCLPDSSLAPCGPGRFRGLADTTFFSLRPMSSGRVLGMHAPLSLAVRQNPRDACLERPDPVVALIAEPFA